MHIKCRIHSILCPVVPLSHPGLSFSVVEAQETVDCTSERVRDIRMLTRNAAGDSDGGYTYSAAKWQTFSEHLAARLPRDVPIFLYHGRDDDTVPFAHVELYARALPDAHVRRLANRNHQLNNNLSEVADDIRRLGDDSKLE